MENRMKSIAQRLEEHASPTPSKWRELFDFLETNKSWLRHSQNIAMLMLDRMEELGMSQKQLAEKNELQPAIHLKGVERTGEPFTRNFDQD